MTRVTYFIHIPKTGGTSLVDYLSRNIVREQTVGIYLPPAGISVHELSIRPKQFKDTIKFVHGHFRYGLHRVIREEHRYFTILRRTSDRLLSAFRHHQRDGLTGDLGLLQYFLKNQPNDMDNYSVRLLANVPDSVGFGAVNESHLNIAKENLTKNIAFFGIFEYYNVSIANLAKAIGAPPPAFPRD